jgi:hypothetical protein
MVNDSDQRETLVQRRRPLAWSFVEIALIFCVFLIVGGDPPPHENEAHYLSRLKHYWNPQWGAGDLFLESADAQLALIWTFGWLTRWLPLAAVAWIGRGGAWLLLAIAWRRLSWRIVPRVMASVLSAALFVALIQYGHLAGEWVVGGVEGKCFAYAFVVLALRDWLDERWNRVWLLFGAAAAFHPLVGGWSAVVCGALWFLKNVAERRIANIAPWKEAASMLPGLLAGGSIALVGIVPALQLTWREPPEIVAEASRIYVFERLPHHLALLTLPPDDWLLRLSRHSILLLALWLLSRAVVPENAALGRVVQFAWGAALLAAIGFTIEVTFWNNHIVAAKLLRYYWFRLTDFAAPMAVSLAAVTLLATGLAKRRPSAAWGLAAAVALAGWFLIDVTRQRAAAFTPPSDRRMNDPAAWQDACRWIADHTEDDALFLTPRVNQSFKWYTGRAEVVTRKDIPQDARNIVEWFRRYREIHFTAAGGETLLDPLPSLGHLGTDRVLQLADKYGIDYVVSDWFRPLWLPVVYPNAAFANSEYVVYRIPPRGERGSRPRDGR